MKIVNFIYIALVALFATSCEAEKWTTEQPQIVNIYEVYDINDPAGDLGLTSIDLYKNKPLMIEHNNKGGLASYNMIDYVDATTAEAYNITYKVHEVDLKTNVVTADREYAITGQKAYGFIYVQIVDNLAGTDKKYDALIRIDTRKN